MSTQTVVREGTVVRPGEVVRYSYEERVCHWSSALTYVFCLLTGLAFYTPYLYWLSVVGGSPATARFLHPWVGVLFFLAALWMHRLWKNDMKATPEDERWKQNIKYYITNQDNLVPPEGRFNAGQKWFYWLMYYCAWAFLISGLVMWFPEKIAGSAHWLLLILIPVHAATALISIAGMIIHVYMGVFLVPGGLNGILYGRVSDQWAAHHHRLWYEKLKRK